MTACNDIIRKWTEEGQQQQLKSRLNRALSQAIMLWEKQPFDIIERRVTFGQQPAKISRLDKNRWGMECDKLMDWIVTRFSSIVWSHITWQFVFFLHEKIYWIFKILLHSLRAETHIFCSSHVTSVIYFHEKHCSTARERTAFSIVIAHFTTASGFSLEYFFSAKKKKWNKNVVVSWCGERRWAGARVRASESWAATKYFYLKLFCYMQTNK